MPADPHRPPIAPATPNRRALILPGGGMRVAYQAGAVKALYDRGLRFALADGASGGTMNLAALLSGLRPDQLCARWRTLDVTSFVSMRPLGAYLHFPATGALGDFDGIVGRVFPHLGIDLPRLKKAVGIDARFNVADFAAKQAVAIPQAEMSLELLCAGISLPLATPPVSYQGRCWTDSVWIRDSNLLGAVEAGADELWVIWCIGNTPAFKPGLLEQYVHMIELAATGHLNRELAAIAAINARIAAGERVGGRDRPIAVHIIRPPVPLPLDPDFLLGRIDAATLIALGHADACRYFEASTPLGTPLSQAATQTPVPGRGVGFRETMRGRITEGEQDPVKGARGPAAIPVALHATINIDDVAAFARDPSHTGRLHGWLEAHRLGGWLPTADGRFGLFTPTADPDVSHMVYDLRLRVDGRDVYMRGRKHVALAFPWRLWPATTTLYVTLHEGRDEQGPIVAAGVLRLGVGALFALLSTLVATGCDRGSERRRAKRRFMTFFAANLARIYLARRRA
jgi:predicted patatin/cPLA2 family phospholipase